MNFNRLWARTQGIRLAMTSITHYPTSSLIKCYRVEVAGGSCKKCRNRRNLNTQPNCFGATKPHFLSFHPTSKRWAILNTQWSNELAGTGAAAVTTATLINEGAGGGQSLIPAKAWQLPAKSAKHPKRCWFRLCGTLILTNIHCCKKENAWLSYDYSIPAIEMATLARLIRAAHLPANLADNSTNELPGQPSTQLTITAAQGKGYKRPLILSDSGSLSSSSEDLVIFITSR